MFVVVVGEMDRDSAEDESEVLSLLDTLKSQYSDLIIISAACKSGIGRFVRDRCIQERQSPEFGFVEYDIKPWVRLSEARLAQVYMSRNPALLEIGEIFHVFSSGKKKGHIADLINRVQKAKLPMAIHLKGRKIQKFNFLSEGII